jgi:DNA-binding Lrp family transcriptional regulator
MSAKAFVMVKVEPTATRRVVEQLKELSGAVVYEVLGPYDIVLDIEADTQEDLTAVLRNSVRTQAGVTDTVTCICF